MPKTHPPYPPECRQRIVELHHAGRSVQQLAAEFDPSEQTIRNWIVQAHLDEGLRGYYQWLRRHLSNRDKDDAMLTEKIRAIHRWSGGTYGAPRIHAELPDEGIFVGCKRVARLMQAARLQGISRRKGPITTRRNRRDRPAPDLVERDFTAEAPNKLWVADITYISTGTGFLYLSVVLDAFSISPWCSTLSVGGL